MACCRSTVNSPSGRWGTAYAMDSYVKSRQEGVISRFIKTRVSNVCESMSISLVSACRSRLRDMYYMHAFVGFTRFISMHCVLYKMSSYKHPLGLTLIRKDLSHW